MRNSELIHVRRRRTRRGFTLVELLVVVTILGIIASIVGIHVYNVHASAQIDLAKTQMGPIREGLEFFRIAFHRYPTTEEGLEILSAPPEGRRPFMEATPQDPWGRPYVYTFPSPTRPDRFELRSKGPDGVLSSEDDLVF